TIFSYGRHFPIARHVETKRGRAVLFTTRDYSVTTTGHKYMVMRACEHLTVFGVQHPTDTNRKAQFEEYRERYWTLARRYSRARSHKPWILGTMRGVVEEANRFAQFFGLRCRLAMPDDVAAMEAECKAIEKREAVRRQREEAKRRQEEAKRQREALERVQQWVDGRIDYCPGYGPIRLRIVGDELQTSRGARVPLVHAVKAFRVIKRLHDQGQTYERNGRAIRLGHFILDAVDTQGNVRAGCHDVAWEEIQRIAILAGVN
ncbi:MAG: hypothetical protein JW888_01000, partial [Pirellulales bacterium]|nr:hypothetical protein [Pirellulales bacterium]